MNLVQFLDENGARRVGAVDADGERLNLLDETPSTHALALDAIAAGTPIAELANARIGAATADYAAIFADKRLLPPLDHADPAHCLVTGTGLSHLGSAEARHNLHAKMDGPAAHMTDSMKMFKSGLEGGKPDKGTYGAQPEWFFKGDGGCLAPPEHDLAMPAFALDGGEEPELAGLYVIGPDGQPYRVGFALGNEFSDHVLEKQNYLLLAHSKLRACSIGPELRTGALPDNVRGVSRVRRGNQVIFEKPFLSGEANMSHSIDNLERHHFKYSMFRRPGDVHVHFFGTATVSFADGLETEPGDVFEIEANDFGKPLRNRLARADDEAVEIQTL